jgi:hypothetical protein
LKDKFNIIIIACHSFECSFLGADAGISFPKMVKVWSRFMTDSSPAKMLLSKRRLWNLYAEYRKEGNLNQETMQHLLCQFELLGNYNSINKLLLKSKSLGIAVQEPLLVRLYAALDSKSDIDRVIGSKPKYTPELINELIKWFIKNKNYDACIRLLKHQTFNLETLELLLGCGQEYLGILKDVAEQIGERGCEMYIEHCNKLGESGSKYIVALNTNGETNKRAIAYHLGVLKMDIPLWVVESNELITCYSNGLLDAGGRKEELLEKIHSINY